MNFRKNSDTGHTVVAENGMIPVWRICALCLRAAILRDILLFPMTTETLCSRVWQLIFEDNSLMALTNGQKRVLESKAIGRRSPYPLGKHLWKVLNDSSLCPDDNVNEKLLKMMLRWIFHRDDNGDCIPMEERCDQARDGRDGLVSNTCLEKQLQETTNKSVQWLDFLAVYHKGSSINYVITFGGLGRPPPPYVIL